MLSPNSLNELHDEYCHRLQEELKFIVEQVCFAELVFEMHDTLFETDWVHRSVLDNYFRCSLEGLALALSRLWESDVRKESTVTIPNLVRHFEGEKYLGFGGLQLDGPMRKRFDSLVCSPLIARLRIVRTEALAHSVKIGKSSDRKKHQLSELVGFGIVNGDIVRFGNDTAELIFDLLSTLAGRKDRIEASFSELKVTSANAHRQFFQKILER